MIRYVVMSRVDPKRISESKRDSLTPAIPTIWEDKYFIPIKHIYNLLNIHMPNT